MKSALIMTEGVAGMWRYHLSTLAKPGLSLCGQWTMRTARKLSSWGLLGDGRMPTSYCEQCVERAKELGYDLKGDEANDEQA